MSFLGLFFRAKSGYEHHKITIDGDERATSVFRLNEIPYVGLPTKSNEFHSLLWSFYIQKFERVGLSVTLYLPNTAIKLTAPTFAANQLSPKPLRAISVLDALNELLRVSVLPAHEARGTSMKERRRRPSSRSNREKTPAKGVIVSNSRVNWVISFCFFFRPYLLRTWYTRTHQRLF